MSTKKKARYATPIGTFNYPWLDKPSKWSNSARDGQGGSIPAESTDVNARYSVKVTFEPETFDSSEFKQQIDDVWGLAQAEHKGKFKDSKPPYWKDDDGNYVLTARCNAAFQKNGNTVTMPPVLEDCEGRNVTDFIKNEGIQVASGSTGRVFVTTYIPEPMKDRDSGKTTIKMMLDLKKAQFKKLERWEGGDSGGSDPIEGGTPVSDDYGDGIAI